MDTIRVVVASLIGTYSSRRHSARPDVCRSPSCETLEGRQLLSAGAWAGVPHWDAVSATGAVQVQSWSGANGVSDHHFPGPHTDFQVKGDPSHTMPPLSAQAKADMQTLASDVSQLQSEVPTTLQAQIKADKTTIENALSSLTPQERRAAFPAPSTKPTTPLDPTTILTTALKAANVSDVTISSISSDLKTYESTLKTVDPTLSAKIQADRAALAKDMPAPTSQPVGRPGPMLGTPGLPLWHGLGF